MKKIFWVDEEVTVAFPDILDLRYVGYDVEHVHAAGEAVDFLHANRGRLREFDAFVIDIQLPFNGDSRFHDPQDPFGTFSGLRLCEIVKVLLEEDGWAWFQSRSVLYTRLPDTPRMERIRRFASDNSLKFIDKSGGESLLGRLRELGLIQ